MKNTIWFFGDCFTSGISLRPSDPYYQYKQEGDKLWTDIVAEELKMHFHRPPYGVGLTAFPWIINEFIKYLDVIKKGDIVIFGGTNPDGVLVYNKKWDKVSSFTCYNMSHEKGCWEFSYSPDKEKTLPFIEHHKMPHTQKWEDFYINQVENIAREILKRGVKTYFWSWKKWFEFEAISDVTDLSISHWSWKGQKQMAEYILKMIKEDKHIKQKSI